MAGIVSTFGILGILVSLAVYLAPVCTFRKIRDKKSTVGYTVIPYTVALFSSAIWLYYGAIRSNATTLVIINTIGCVIEMAYVAIFCYYSGHHDRIFTITISSMLFGLFCAITFVTYFTCKGDLRIMVVGWICFGSSILVYSSTIGTVVRAVRTRSVQGIPITLTCVLTANAVIWGIYGFAKGDANIWIPNIIGLVLGIGQIVVYGIFRTPQTGEITGESETTETI